MLNSDKRPGSTSIYMSAIEGSFDSSKVVCICFGPSTFPSFSRKSARLGSEFKKTMGAGGKTCDSTALREYDKAREDPLNIHVERREKQVQLVYTGPGAHSRKEVSLEMP